MSAEALMGKIVELQSRIHGQSEDVLSNIDLALSGILEAMERPDTSVADAIISGLKGLTISAPDVNVNLPAPEVVVNVQPATVNCPPAQVTVMPGQQIKGWRLTVVERDQNGGIRDVILRPEK